MSARRIPLGAWRVLGIANPGLRLAMLAILAGLGLSLCGAVLGDTQSPIRAGAPLRGSPGSRVESPKPVASDSGPSTIGLRTAPTGSGLRAAADARGVVAGRMLSPESCPAPGFSIT